MLTRLEAATSRLEDIVISQQGVTGTAESASGAAVATPSDREVAAAPAVAGAPPSGTNEQPAVSMWDTDVVPALDKYVAASATLGGLVKEQSESVAGAFAQERVILQVASACARPKDGIAAPECSRFLNPLQEKLMATVEIRDKNRGSDQFNHMSAVSEGISAMGWIVVVRAF